MPQASLEKYSPKQKHQAHKIEESAKERGYSEKRAEEIGWATVNKQTGCARGKQGGGSKGSGSGSGPSKAAAAKGGRKSL